MDYSRYVVPVAVALAAGVFVLALRHAAAEKQEFMDECQQHKPRFECVALWKSVQPDTVNVYTD